MAATWRTLPCSHREEGYGEMREYTTTLGGLAPGSTVAVRVRATSTPADGDDAEALCAFLRQVAIEEGRPPPIHGIHDQKTYIDAPLRRRLETEAGVVGWRFVQRQGDAVFIPAGCPHQVRGR